MFENLKIWLKHLPWAEYWYNTSLHTTIGMTPFKVLYGQDPPLIINYTLTTQDPPSIQEQLRLHDQLLVQLKGQLSKAQTQMKHFIDSHRTKLEFQISDMVFVKLQPYRQHLLALQWNRKLGLKYFGPFLVIKCIGSVAYKLLLPLKAKIHLIFHISLLKKCMGDVAS